MTAHHSGLKSSIINEFYCREQDLNNSVFDVSVIMATYNPVWEKCVFTLDSVVGQKNINLELIVVDDGSVDNLFGKFIAYFEYIGFSNYSLIEHKENQGTVKNYYDGLLAAKGKYIKLISPGDALFNDNTLASWMSFLYESGRFWSFSDAVYYEMVDCGLKISRTPVAPRIIDCYEKGNNQACRWNYVVLEDLPLGAAILCERVIFLKYLSSLIDRVIFSEDLSYMLMMYDEELPAYYSKSCLIYEFGCGVSTSTNEKWRKRFLNDLKNAEMLIVDKPDKDEYQKKMSNALKRMNSGGRLKKRLLKNLQKGGLKKVFKYRFNPRMSSVDISECGKWFSVNELGDCKLR